jgi:TolB-like protein/AraC-like DNA-binding protein/lipopolysaccharide biosynthesis regulator YciM
MTAKLSIDQALIEKLISIIEINLENEKLGVAELATEIGLSRSQLHRRLKDINGKSTSQFMREYRLEKAMEMLKRNQATASEIAYRVGFASPTYFNTCFHNFYGYPPGEVKFQKAIAPPKKTFSKKLMGIIPVIILVGLIVFNETYNKTSVDVANLEKTIAILPFVNNSPNKENMYFCNGIMAGIRDHLAKIPEISIVSRRSVEQYRNTTSPLKTIAKELDVNYVVEGHVQRISDRAIISIELIRVTDNKIIWSDSYDKDVSQIFAVQASVVQSITTNLQTIISPNLKSELNTKPTQDKSAYEHYLKGEEFRFKANRPFQKNDVWLNLLDKARLSFELAIKQDTLYVPAYLSLAMTVQEKNSGYVNDENNLDEVLILTNKALQINPNASLAYVIRGNYYSVINQKDKAIKDYQKALEIIPNNTSALYSLIRLYKWNNNYKDAVLTLKRLEEFAISRDDLIPLYDNYIEFYRILEQHDMVDYYYNKIFKIRTIPQFNMARVWSYIQSNRFDEPLTYVKESLHEDNQQRNGLLAYIYERKKEYPKALEYYKKCYEQVEVEGINTLASSVVYWGYGINLMRIGQTEKGKKMIKKQISIYDEILKSKRPFNKPMIYLGSSQLHASLGQYEQAHDYIEKFDSINGWLHWEWMVYWVQKDPAYSLLLEDPIFKASIKRGEKQVADIQNQIRPYLPSIPIKRD